jgi:uncharacterized membrane protein YhaH (DUF805 family)
MLGYLFGFNARIGRLKYFLCSIVLVIVITIMIAGTVSSSYRGLELGTPLSLSQMKWPLIFVGAIFAVASFTLYSMRFRDIGWDPVCMIPLWLAVAAVDWAIGAKIPAISLGQDHHGTIVGALMNLALGLALMFWPSGSHDISTPTFDMPPQAPDAPPRRQEAASPAASRVARVAGGEFGRRTG